MFKNKFSILATVLMASTASIANATTTKGLYVMGGAGANITQDQHNSSSFGASTGIHSKAGFDGFAGVGYGYGNGLRAEVEGYYGRSFATDSASGSSQSFGGFVNVLYDIDLKKHFNIDTFVTPYVGVGAGYLVNQYNMSTPVRQIHGTQGSFAYQGIVGASFDTGVPGLQATVDYRMVGQTMSGDSYSPEDSHFDHRFNHTFNVGLRYTFDSEEPKATEAVSYVPVVEPSRTYLVFFEWDKSDLGSTAKRIVANAANASTHIHTTTITVNGYSDNSTANPGPVGEKYNYELSVRRAKSVEAELIKDGVPEKYISIRGYGDNSPLVKTDANTREAQNRRVEIILK